jgi:hypothetical protein
MDDAERRAIAEADAAQLASDQADAHGESATAE